MAPAGAPAPPPAGAAPALAPIVDAASAPVAEGKDVCEDRLGDGVGRDSDLVGRISRRGSKAGRLSCCGKAQGDG